MSSALANPKVRSRLYLRAVLPCLSELVEIDPVAREILGNTQGSLALRIFRGPATVITLQRGRIVCELNANSGGSVRLLFVSDSHLNAFFSGNKWAIPILTWGGWRIGLLKCFSRLAQRLEAALNGEASVVDSSAGRRLHARLSLMAAGLGLPPLAQGDHISQMTLRALPFGLASFTIKGEANATTWFEHGADHSAAGWGEPPRAPEVCIAFDGIETAYAAMRDQIDAVAAVGRGQIRVDGLVPLADGLNFVMQRLRVYLQP
jgi:hypothetical protein